MIKKLILASAMAVAPLMAAGPEEATKKRINIEHANGFKFKKIHSPFAKMMLNWMGNLTLLGTFLATTGLVGLADREFELGHELHRSTITVYGSALNILFAIGCKLASDKLFTEQEDKAVLSNGHSWTTRKQLSSEETAQQDQIV